jgi:hypothetical protein
MRRNVPMPAMAKFLVLALFYGDHPALAQRCGATLRALWNTGKVDLRIGLNEVSPRSRAILEGLLPGVDLLSADPQIYKYPMLHRLVQTYAGDATHIMWFDDDSCLLPGTDAASWLAAVTRRAESATGALGALYEHRLTEAQRAWIEAQPWFTGRPIGDSVLFATGGWFVLPLALMRRFGWPGPLQHAGGDITLGALLQQQGLVPEPFRVGLAINADAQLRESKASRRGVSEALGSTTAWGCGG